MSNRVRITLGFVMLFTAVGAGWAYFRYLREDPEVAQLERSLEDVLSDVNSDRLEHTEALARLGGIKQNLSRLPEHRQQAVMRSLTETYQQVMEEHFRRYVNLSASEKRELLDQEIDRKIAAMSELRAKNEQVTAKRKKKKAIDWEDLSSDEQKSLLRQKMDQTTPKGRALWAVYAMDFKRRWAERGL